MSKELKFRTRGGGTLTIHANVMEVLETYRPKVMGENEAGGFFIGGHAEEDGLTNFIIETLTCPMPGDVQEPEHFMAVGSHIDVIQEKYRESDGRLWPVGQWHTHPDRDLPRPSNHDWRIWRGEVGAIGYGPGTLFFMIVTNTSLKVWEGRKSDMTIIEIIQIGGADR